MCQRRNEEIRDARERNEGQIAEERSLKRGQHVLKNKRFCCSRKSMEIVIWTPSRTLPLLLFSSVSLGNLTPRILPFLIRRMEKILDSQSCYKGLVEITEKKHLTEFLVHSNNKFYLNDMIPNPLTGLFLSSVVFCMIPEHKHCESQNKQTCFFFFVSRKCECLGFLFGVLSK